MRNSWGYFSKRDNLTLGVTPSMTNIKRLTFVALLCIGTCQVMADTANRLLEVPIAAVHRTCSSADECALVHSRCDSCSCGMGVNRRFELEYRSAYEELCRNYQGPHCARICAPQGLVCVDSQCQVSFAGDQIK